MTHVEATTTTGRRKRRGSHLQAVEPQRQRAKKSTAVSTKVAQRAVAQPLPPAGSMLELIERAARDPSIDVEKMKQLLTMRREEEGRVAERAFSAALKSAQEAMPPIVRDAYNRDTRSWYAKLETVTAAIAPIAAANGFTPSFGSDTSPLPNHYRVTCELAHVGGHTRHYHVDVPTDMLGPKGSPVKTATHGWGSAMTYGQRKLLCMIFNVVLKNQDDDGNRAGIGPVITQEQSDALIERLESVGLDRKRVLEFYQIETLADLPQTKYSDALKRCDEYAAAKARREQEGAVK